MSEKSHHRLARLLRVAVSWFIAFHGSLMPRAIGTLYAQNIDIDSISIGVRPVSLAPPASIADLLASANPAIEGQISLTWTAPQGNVGGVPINNQPVAAYMLHVATFSVASLAGDTTSWWNATAASNIMLQSPSYIPKNPGQLESYPITGLIPGATYYFAAKSISMGGITSPVDTEASSPALQAKAVATKFIVGTGGTPMRPNGLSSSAAGGIFTLKWHPVTLDSNKQAISIDHYQVYRYNTIGSSPTVSMSVSAADPTLNDTIGGQLYFYRVVTVAVGGIVSEASDYMDSSAQANRYAIAADDNDTRVVLPGALALELNSENNIYGEDLEIRLERRSQDEFDVTLKSYHIGIYKVLANQELPFYSFSQSGMQVQLGLGSTLGTGQLNTNQVQSIRNARSTSAGSIAQIVSVYWFNGGSYIRISDPVLTSNQALSVSVRNVGIYQVRAAQLSSVFKLTQGSPYPRVITPNDPSQNNRVFWFFDNPTDDAVTGKIYDIRGAKVRDLAVNGQSPTANSIVWDGRDFNGAVVPSGVYLYKISTGKDSQTGTVVVAR